MADKKITQLTNITGADLVNADEFVVVDASADETKAITFGELKEAFDTSTGFVRITGDTMTGDLTVPNVVVSGNVDGRDVSADGTKLDGIEASADVTDTANVTAAGALMDSEVTNLAQVKAFDSADYATAAQGTLADSAIQSGDLATVATTGAYSDLTGKPTLGTAAATAATDYATAAQGTLADSAVQTNDSPTFNVVTATSFAGDGSALTGLPAGYTDADVDAHLNYSTATTGQVLSYSGSDYDWIDAGGAGATGGGSDEIFWENGQNVTTNYTITNGKNAMSAGPITIDSGVTVTVGAGETWTVV